MLAKRVIPTVLVRGKTAFKGPGFGQQCTRSIGSALSVCRTHAMRGVDELLILDIAATAEGRPPDLDLVQQLADECFIPMTVGGGVRSLSDIDALLRAGADKVAVCTAVREQPGFVNQAADRFGRQAIVVVVEFDSKEARDPRDSAIYRVPITAGEVVIQCRTRDGTMSGYDLHLLQKVIEGFEGPVIVSGGCSGPADMLRAIKAGADGCAAGALFQFTECTPRDCTDYLLANGVEVRA